MIPPYSHAVSTERLWATAHVVEGERRHVSRGDGRFAQLWVTHEATISAAILLLHAVIGLAMYHSRAVAALHGILAMGVAAGVAMTRRPAEAAAAAAYLAGSDVLWRVCSAPIPYEGGKYAVAI